MCLVLLSLNRYFDRAAAVPQKLKQAVLVEVIDLDASFRSKSLPAAMQKETRSAVGICPSLRVQWSAVVSPIARIDEPSEKSCLADLFGIQCVLPRRKRPLPLILGIRVAIHPGRIPIIRDRASLGVDQLQVPVACVDGIRRLVRLILLALPVALLLGRTNQRWEIFKRLSLRPGDHFDREATRREAMPDEDQH